MKYIVDMQDDWKVGECDFCYGVNECLVSSAEQCTQCPLANAKVAVEVTNSLSVALETSFDKPVKIYAVDYKEPTDV